MLAVGRNGIQFDEIAWAKPRTTKKTRAWRNMEIEVRQAVQRDRQETPKHPSATRLFRSARATVETPGALQQHVEDRTEKQQCGRDAESAAKFQIVVVGVTHKFYPRKQFVPKGRQQRKCQDPFQPRVPPIN